MKINSERKLEVNIWLPRSICKLRITESNSRGFFPYGFIWILKDCLRRKVPSWPGTWVLRIWAKVADMMLQTQCLRLPLLCYPPSTVLQCSSFLSVAGISALIKKSLGQESVSFIVQVTVCHWGKSCQELRQELKAEPWKSTACWLFFWPRLN